MTPITDRAGRFSALKILTLAGLLAPAAYVAVRYWSGDLGPLPVKEVLLVCGLWAIRLLMVTLALTPLQRLLNQPKITLVRRMTGIAAFAYAAAHFMLYVAMAKFNLAFVASEIVLRIYLTIGFVALAGLSLLAATSTDRALRRLGQRWKQLHRVVYGVAVLGLLHFYMQSKIDVSEATLMAGLFLLLMLYRLAIWRRVGLAAPVLAVAAAAAAGLTATVEFAWYALATGVNPWPILKANLMLTYGVRPAAAVLLAGLAVAAWPLARGWFRGVFALPPAAMPRSGRALR